MISAVNECVADLEILTGLWATPVQSHGGGFTGAAGAGAWPAGPGARADGAGACASGMPSQHPSQTDAACMAISITPLLHVEMRMT